MKFWQVLFDNHLGWKASILVQAEYPAYCEQDALDEAADSDEGQKYVMHDIDLADFKTDEERDEYCMYLGNASQPFARENLAMREATVADILVSEASFRPVNTDPETFLEEALKEEHHDNNSSCDICVAIREELYLWAAHVLIGAADCPITEAAYAWLHETEKDFDKKLEEERLALLEVDHQKCEKCNSITWGDRYYSPEACGNCLAVFPVADEHSQE